MNLDDIFRDFMQDQEIQTGDYYRAKSMILWLSKKGFLSFSNWFRLTPLARHREMTLFEMNDLLNVLKKEQKSVISSIHWLEGLILLKEKK